jgi:hypothetical protein
MPGTSSISGNLVLDGVSFLGSQGRNKNNLSLRIGGDLLLTNSTFTTGVFGNYDLFVNGNVNLKDASIWLGSNNTTCHFSGTGTTIWTQSPGSDAILGNTVVEPLHNLRVESETFAEIAPRCTFSVEAGAGFYTGKSILTGDGTFILEDKATLGIGHSDGLYSESLKGNIQTAGRIYHSGATYVFNSQSSNQQTGVFETAPVKNTVRNLILEKEKKSQVLVLSQDISIEDQFHIARGDIRTGNFELRVPQMQVRR